MTNLFFQKNFYNLSVNDKRNKIFNKEFPSGRIIQIGELEIKQNESILKMQKNLNSEIYNFDYNLNKEILDSKYGLFLNIEDKSSDDSSSEEE